MGRIKEEKKALLLVLWWEGSSGSWNLPGELVGEGGQPAVKDTTSSPLNSMASAMASAASRMETSSSSPTVEEGRIVAVPSWRGGFWGAARAYLTK